MVKMISIHSSRGGTGKSLISSNLSTIFASQGKNMALLDFDFRAPSIHAIFKAKNMKKKWVNEYLDTKKELKDIMVDISQNYGTDGKLIVGFANPDMEAMREIAMKDRKWQMKALKQTMEIKQKLVEDFEIEIIIIDTGPGIQYSSVNAVVSADVSVIVSTMDVLDIEGVQNMIKDLYEPFDKNAFVIVNKATPHSFVSDEKRSSLLKDVKGKFKQPIIAIIPCYCDILLSNRTSIFILDRPQHPFTWALNEVANRLSSLTIEAK